MGQILAGGLKGKGLREEIQKRITNNKGHLSGYTETTVDAS